MKPIPIFEMARLFNSLHIGGAPGLVSLGRLSSHVPDDPS